MMLPGLMGVPVVSLISKPPKKEYADDIFACCDKKVVVSVKHGFGDPVQKED